MTALLWALVAGPLLGLLTDAIETWWESRTRTPAATTKEPTSS